MRVSLLFAVFGSAMMVSSAAIPVSNGALVDVSSLERRQGLLQSLSGQQAGSQDGNQSPSGNGNAVSIGLKYWLIDDR